ACRRSDGGETVLFGRGLISPPLHLQGRGTAEGGGGVFVSGHTLAAGVNDVRHNTLEIISHVRSRHPDRLDSTAGEPRISSFVALRVASKFVRQAIHLNRDSRFVAEEVEIIGPVLVLLTEF